MTELALTCYSVRTSTDSEISQCQVMVDAPESLVKDFGKNSRTTNLSKGNYVSETD